mmetsp:Transcript_20125/g.52524  ORF Transcript_20125/g.52524 Transcript_20125/m.52524 type:complete len:202 (+) Transcript_20125:706-1311(+)
MFSSCFFDFSGFDSGKKTPQIVHTTPATRPVASLGAFRCFGAWLAGGALRGGGLGGGGRGGPPAGMIDVGRGAGRERIAAFAGGMPSKPRPLGGADTAGAPDPDGLQAGGGGAGQPPGGCAGGCGAPFDSPGMDTPSSPGAIWLGICGRGIMPGGGGRGKAFIALMGTPDKNASDGCGWFAKAGRCGGGGGCSDCVGCGCI